MSSSPDLPPNTPKTDPGDLVPLGIAVEGGLAILAIVGGWLFGVDVVEQLRFEVGWDATYLTKLAGLSILGVVPMLALLWMIESLSWAPVARLREFSHETLVPMFAEVPIAGLLVISCAAGFGEELLFRGLMQNVFVEWMPVWVAIVVAAGVFGAMHYLTLTYACLATLMGCYLGILYLATDQIWVPIISHAVYDFVALCYMRQKPPLPTEP